MNNTIGIHVGCSNLRHFIVKNIVVMMMMMISGEKMIIIRLFWKLMKLVGSFHLIHTASSKCCVTENENILS